MKPGKNYKLKVAVFLAFAFAATAAKADGRQQSSSVPLQPSRGVGQSDLLTSLRHTLNKMRNIKVEEGDPGIPALVRPLMTELKHGLRDLIRATLNDKAAPWKAPSEVSARVLSILQRNLALVENPESGKDCTYSYGKIVGIDLAQPAGYPDLLEATTTLWVMCGGDTSLYLFRNVAGEWQLAADQEVNGYKDISDAQGDFRYAVSPRDADGRFFIVTANVTPWCTSAWQRLRYRVFRVGETQPQSKTLLQREETIYLDNEDYPTISIQPESFQIVFDGGQELDTDILVRKHTVAYRVAGDQISRVPPFASEPEGFLDEWCHLPWEEAAKWVEPSALVGLHKWHERLRSWHSEKDPSFFTQFVYDSECETEKGPWQVGIEFSPNSKGASLPVGMPQQIYFSVALKGGAYLLVGVSGSAMPKCTQERSSGQ